MIAGSVLSYFWQYSTWCISEGQVNSKCNFVVQSTREIVRKFKKKRFIPRILVFVQLKKGAKSIILVTLALQGTTEYCRQVVLHKECSLGHECWRTEVGICASFQLRSRVLQNRGGHLRLLLALWRNLGTLACAQFG